MVASRLRGILQKNLSDFVHVYCFCFELTLDHPVQLFRVLGVTQQLENEVFFPPTTATNAPLFSPTLLSFASFVAHVQQKCQVEL